LTARQRAWADLMSFERRRDSGGPWSRATLVTRCRSRTVSKVDSVGFVVRSTSRCSVILGEGLGPFGAVEVREGLGCLATRSPQPGA